MLPAYNVVLLQPTGYIHSMALHEVGLLLYHSLASLGYPCRYQINQIDTDAVNVILGYNLLPDASAIPSCEFVIYQLEQLSDREGWFRPQCLDIFRRAREVWDYSTDNIAFLTSRGVENVRHLPVGFHEKLQSIQPQPLDIDVLFYGSVNERREAVLKDLARDCNVKILFGVYGQERDQYIARSKIVLNIHFYEAQIMEQPRIAYLLNNARFVVSEDSKVNPYGDGFSVAPYALLADRCRYWLHRSNERDQISKTNFELFRKNPMIEYLKRILSTPSNL